MRRNVLRFSWLLTLVAPLGLAVACIDTEGTMKEYLDRTADIRGVAQSDTGPPPDVTVGTGGLTPGTYYVVCLPALAGGDLEKSLRFKATVTYDDAVAPAESTMSMKFQILPINGVKTSEAIGPIFPDPTAASSLVRDGYFKLNFGTSPTLPKEGNGLTHADFGLSDLIVEGLLTAPPTRFCTALNGKTQPSGIEIKRDLDFCIGQLVTDENAAMPVPAPNEYACPVVGRDAGF